MRHGPRVFLTAEWRDLAMLNYAAPPELLGPYLPCGTTLDLWNGEAYVSVVGFLFRDVRVLGVPIPFHRHFEEVNLRFYVRREVAGEVRRAVTFVRELVPRRMIAAVAHFVYNEPYRALPMRHRVSPEVVEYAWRQRSGWARLSTSPSGDAHSVTERSEEEFVTVRHWGYTPQRDGSTVEYQVEHPRWRVWPVRDAVLEGNVAEVYGSALADVVRNEPRSAFVADGSRVVVRAPLRLPG